jgi:hypothetical protein
MRLSDWLTRSFPWLRPFATDLWGGLTDLQIQGLRISLLIEPFKKILHCNWLIFSTDSQREVFVNMALVYSVYYFYERFLPAISGNIFDNVQFAIAANDLESLQRLYTELEKNIDASRTNFVDKLLSGAMHQQHKQKPRYKFWRRELLLEKDKGYTAIR